MSDEEVNPNLPLSVAPEWRMTANSVVLAVFAILALFWPTFQSTARIWFESDTFMHGAIIPLLSIYLVWRIRHLWLPLSPKPNAAGVFWLGICGAVWFAGDLAAVDLLKQLAVWSMLPAAVFAIAGYSVFRTVLFPLCYLIFAVPFGESLVPGLMEFTADFTVNAVTLIGIPVYREGFFFQLPSGNFEVAKACSGVRYLIASVALGALFAYLTYQSWRRRLIFMCFAIVLPIIANGIRAFGIVLIAHYSNREYAVGIDHFIYGWVFFGIVIYTMFFVGMKWSEPEKTAVADTDMTSLTPATRRQHLMVFIAVIAALLPFRIWSENISLLSNQAKQIAGVHLVNSSDEWQPRDSKQDFWRPTFNNSDVEAIQAFVSSEGSHVYVYSAAYASQAEGKELINATNTLYPVNQWTIIGETNQGLRMTGQRKGVAIEKRLQDLADNKWLLWYWYEVDGQAIASETKAKLLDVKSKLLGSNPRPSAVVAILTPLNHKLEVSRDRIRSFVLGINSAEWVQQ